ncbi:MAG: hypothetical protein LQ341_001134 [Variospora aurantia]|nr:MAG: hypothetical protein LQ341_001134 [Variospora aurantia]
MRRPFVLAAAGMPSIRDDDSITALKKPVRYGGHPLHFALESSLLAAVSLYGEEYEAELGRMGYQQTMRELQGELLGPSDPRHKMVGRTLARLLPNSGLKGDWEFHVIDDPNEINAFVIPGGKVFVYSGILPICKNEDGLAAVLGHEIAHNMCHHVQENASLPWLITLVVGLVSIFLDNSARVTQLVLNYALELPNSRAQEVGAHGKSTEDYRTTTALYSSHCTSRPAAYAAERELMLRRTRTASSEYKHGLLTRTFA